MFATCTQDRASAKRCRAWLLGGAPELVRLDESPAPVYRGVVAVERRERQGT